MLQYILLILVLAAVFYVHQQMQNPANDCEGDWVWAEECTEDCSSGKSKLVGTYKVTKAATGFGKCDFKDGETTEKPCPVDMCPPEDCIGDWVDDEICIGSCSKRNATRFSQYVIEEPARYGGEKCDIEAGKVKEVECPYNMCPPEKCVHTVEWEDCEGYDVNSKRTGAVKIVREGKFGGECDYTEGQIMEELCPRSLRPTEIDEDCEGGWVWDESCAGMCSDNSAIQSATYVVTKEHSGSGAYCPFEDGEIKTQPCPEDKCPPEDCKHEWVWNETCEGGSTCTDGMTLTGTYKKLGDPLQGGAACEFDDGDTKEIVCPESKCPREDCVGEWNLKDSVDNEYVTGMETYEFNILSQLKYGGASCEAEQGDTKQQLISVE